MGRGHPTSRPTSYVTGLEILLEAKNDKIAELERQLAEAEGLLKKLIPLIPPFRFDTEQNLPISNYDYLKSQERWKLSKDKIYMCSNCDTLFDTSEEALECCQCENCAALKKQLEDMTLARDEIQKMHDTTIRQLERSKVILKGIRKDRKYLREQLDAANGHQREWGRLWADLIKLEAQLEALQKDKK